MSKRKKYSHILTDKFCVNVFVVWTNFYSYAIELKIVVLMNLVSHFIIIVKPCTGSELHLYVNVEQFL